MSKITSKRVKSLDSNNIWAIIQILTKEKNPVNLGQGFPSWQPPDFFLKRLCQNTLKCNYQYTRDQGSIQLVQAIAKYHTKQFGHIYPKKQILSTCGATEALSCAILGYVNPGDQVIIFEPAFNFYAVATQFAGGKTIGVILKPKIFKPKQTIKNFNQSSQDDQWEIDFKDFQSKLNLKTKMIILNTPHNPTGKVFTVQQLERLAIILEKFPQIIIVQDLVYDHMVFDEILGQSVPKLSHISLMKNRILSIYSGGKLLSATGIKLGWVIGKDQLLNPLRTVHNFVTSCSNNLIQMTVAQCLQTITQTNYHQELSLRLKHMRNKLVKYLIQSKYAFKIWIPKGGYFVMVDITDVKVKQKYYFYKGDKVSKDYAFIFQLIQEDNILAIPCSPFYSKDNKQYGQNLIRFTFCKDEQILQQAGKRMK